MTVKIKKKYEAPKMTVVEMKFEANLLSCSSCDGPDTDEYDDEFGMNGVSGGNRRA